MGGLGSPGTSLQGVPIPIKKAAVAVAMELPKSRRRGRGAEPSEDEAVTLGVNLSPSSHSLQKFKGPTKYRQKHDLGEKKHQDQPRPKCPLFKFLIYCFFGFLEHQYLRLLRKAPWGAVMGTGCRQPCPQSDTATRNRVGHVLHFSRVLSFGFKLRFSTLLRACS